MINKCILKNKQTWDTTKMLNAHCYYSIKKNFVIPPVNKKIILKKGL